MAEIDKAIAVHIPDFAAPSGNFPSYEVAWYVSRHCHHPLIQPLTLLGMNFKLAQTYRRYRTGIRIR